MESKEPESSCPYLLEKFYLFQTTSNFYVFGRDKGRVHWRVLKIDRSEPSELLIHEDPTTYSSTECKNLLQGIKEGNKATGGCEFVTTCYGIVGFIRFSGPYYVILIIKRRKIGQICGHPIYAISEYKTVPIHHSTILSSMDDFEREDSDLDRYTKLLRLVDIKKDFFFSYSYPIMHCLEKNLHRKETGEFYEGKMFVWNEYLTRHIRQHLKNTLWTVALVHGYFKQVKLSNCGKSFRLTLIARRSSHFAGTRYQKRGVNDLGDAANDVEIEQIVCEDIHGGHSYKMTSAVQIRGSIPLSWSQKPAFLSVRPRIKVSALRNSSYQPTQLHFINLHRRYRHPIIILNLVKKRGDESRLSIGFRRAVDCINMVFPEDKQLNFLRFDLDTAFRTKGIGALKDLKDMAASALEQIKFFCCQMPQSIHFEASSDFSDIRSSANCTNFDGADSKDEDNCSKLQQGILRTNCIDSLDRTNVAQYVYGLVSLGHQLHALDINGTPNLGLNHALAYELMSIYEAMGDALAHQYGGSAAQNKIFAEFRGQCKLATRFLLFIRKVQRHCSNSFRDFDKQKAIDIFLGPFQQQDESPPSSSDSYQPRLQRTASDSEVLHMPSSDLGYLPSSPEFSTSRWCAPVGRLRFDMGSPHLGGAYFRSSGNYFTDTDEAGPLLWSQWSESENEQELYESEDED